MNTLNNAVFALATGLLAVGLASSSASAQMSKSAAGFTPGEPFVVTISTVRGTPIMIVQAGRVPLQSDRRVRLFLPDLGDGPQELVYVLSLRGDLSVRSSQKVRSMTEASQAEADVNKRSRERAGRLRSYILSASPVGPKLGKQGGKQSGSTLSIGADGMHHTFGYDLSGDIVGEEKGQAAANQVSDAGSLGKAGDGGLTGGAAGSNNVSTSTGMGGKAP
jgi:hypothetical protein